ncbi:MAG: hypothetical protein ACLFUS_11370, partial [Candidatus Sumerlaeia bacterium]
AKYYKLMIEDQDHRKIRCRRLGHEVPFSYCRCESGDKPCRLILDCWWEQFDVRDFLEKNLPAETVQELIKKKAPPNKISSLIDLIQQAKNRSRDDSEA